MRLCVLSGSRADWGLLEWPLRLLQADPDFEISVVKLWGHDAAQALDVATRVFTIERNDGVLLLGDRFEVLAAALAAHLARIPIFHIAGGDVTPASYDDAMRDCISRLATLHFATSRNAAERLQWRGYQNVHLVGSPGVDYILHYPWKTERPYQVPYQVVSYQAETATGVIEIEKLLSELPDKLTVFILPNRDRGSEEITKAIEAYRGGIVIPSLPHPEFLNLIYWADEFIGNSSAIFYEAPFMDVKTRLIGRRQEGRVRPFGDGKASERIVLHIKEWHGLRDSRSRDQSQRAA